MNGVLTYTTVTEVKRILRTNVQKRVNFPGHIRKFGPSVDNISDINLAKVSFLDTYDDQENVVIEFVDSTSFKVISVDESVGIRGSINYGQYTVFEDVTTSNGIIILSSDWSGGPADVSDPNSPDSILFETEVHLDYPDATAYIFDSEIWVDAYLKKAVFQDTSVALNTRLFDSTAIPYEIQWATTRFAAFFIYNDVYNTNIEGMHSTNPQANNIEPSLNWYQQGVRMLDRFIDNYNSQEQQSAPRWYSFDRTLTSRGVADIGQGIAIPQLDNAPDILFDPQFDDLLEPDVAISIFDTIRRNT